MTEHRVYNPDRPSAHPPGRSVIVDASGVSMAWKVVGSILGFFVASGALWTALGLAKVQDLSDHNTTKTAHQVVLEPGQEPIPMARAVREQHKAQKKYRADIEELKQGYQVIVTVKLDLDTDRAERLADRAADRVRSPQRSREVWKTVRDGALENLRAGRSIRAGLERYLD